MGIKIADKLQERWSVSSKFTAFEVWIDSFTQFRSVPGNHNQTVVVRSIGGRGTYLTSTADIDVAGYTGLRFFADPKAVPLFLEAATEAARAYRRAASDLSAGAEEMSDAELAGAFDQLFAANTRCMAYYKITSDEFVAMCEARLEAELAGLGTDRVELLQVAMSADEAGLDVTLERRAWAPILRKRLDSGILDTSEIASHAARFGYLGAMGGNPGGWDGGFYEARLNRPLEQMQRELVELENAEAEMRGRLRDRQEADERLTISPWAALVVSHLRDATANRMYIRECFTNAANASNALFQQLYKRIAIAGYVDQREPCLRQLSMTDIAAFLRGEGLDVNDLRLRSAGFVMILNADQTVTTAVSRQDEENQVTVQKLSTSPVELSGRTVWGRDNITGRAFVLDSGLSQVDKLALIDGMREGDVLVTGMTHPNIIEACERAAAIVTDEGGLTCHAAIVARELNIPCVVGTGKATKLIRTGDTIEINPAAATVVARMGNAN